jgi:hypothetical protein
MWVNTAAALRLHDEVTAASAKKGIHDDDLIFQHSPLWTDSA